MGGSASRTTAVPVARREGTLRWRLPPRQLNATSLLRAVVLGLHTALEVRGLDDQHRLAVDAHGAGALADNHQDDHTRVFMDHHQNTGHSLGRWTFHQWMRRAAGVHPLMPNRFAVRRATARPVTLWLAPRPPDHPWPRALRFPRSVVRTGNLLVWPGLNELPHPEAQRAGVVVLEAAAPGAPHVAAVLNGLASAHGTLAPWALCVEAPRPWAAPPAPPVVADPGVITWWTRLLTAGSPTHRCLRGWHPEDDPNLRAALHAAAIATSEQDLLADVLQLQNCHFHSVEAALGAPQARLGFDCQGLVAFTARRSPRAPVAADDWLSAVPGGAVVCWFAEDAVAGSAPFHGLRTPLELHCGNREPRLLPSTALWIGRPFVLADLGDFDVRSEGSPLELVLRVDEGDRVHNHVRGLAGLRALVPNGREVRCTVHVRGPLDGVDGLWWILHGVRALGAPSVRCHLPDPSCILLQTASNHPIVDGLRGPQPWLVLAPPDGGGAWPSPAVRRGLVFVDGAPEPIQWLDPGDPPTTATTAVELFAAVAVGVVPQGNGWLVGDLPTTVRTVTFRHPADAGIASRGPWWNDPAHWAAMGPWEQYPHVDRWIVEHSTMHPPHDADATALLAAADRRVEWWLGASGPDHTNRQGVAALVIATWDHHRPPVAPPAADGVHPLELVDDLGDDAGVWMRLLRPERFLVAPPAGRAATSHVVLRLRPGELEDRLLPPRPGADGRRMSCLHRVVLALVNHPFTGNSIRLTLEPAWGTADDGGRRRGERREAWGSSSTGDPPGGVSRDGVRRFLVAERHGKYGAAVELRFTAAVPWPRPQDPPSAQDAEDDEVDPEDSNLRVLGRFGEDVTAAFRRHPPTHDRDAVTKRQRFWLRRWHRQAVDDLGALRAHLPADQAVRALRFIYEHPLSDQLDDSAPIPQKLVEAYRARGDTMDVDGEGWS